MQEYVKAHDVLRQRELLEAIHEANGAQLRTAGIIGRLLRTAYGPILADPLSFARPYRDFAPRASGEPIDIAAIELGIINRPRSQAVVQIGHITVEYEPIPYRGFMEHDVLLVETMLGGLRDDYNIGLLPNLNRHCTAIVS